MASLGVATRWQVPHSKISPPAASGLVARPRLFDRLDQASGGVIVVMAQGGSGKTSLVASWLHARQAGAVVWYSLDEDDRDPRRCLLGLCAAVEHARPEACSTPMAAIRAGEPTPAVAAALAAVLAETPTTLVLDDFHWADGAAELLAVLDRLLLCAWNATNVIILSRTEPGLRLPTLIDAPRLACIVAGDLLFDDGEAAALLAAHRLPAEAAASPAQQAAGWAGGILWLARSRAPALVALLGNRQRAFEALGQQFLVALPRELHTFALESAALCPATREQVAALLACPDVRGSFEALRRHGLFVAAGDDGVVRYHELLATYLAGALAATDGDRYRTLRRRRATLYLEGGEPERAATLLLGDEDWEALAGFLERHLQLLADQCSFATIDSCVAALPRTLRTADLMVHCGNACHMEGRFARAMRWADAALAATDDSEVACRALLARASALYELGRYSEVLPLTESCARRAQAVPDAALRAGAIARAADLGGFVLLTLGRRQEGEAKLALAEAHFAGTDAIGSQARIIMNRALGLVAAGWGPEALAHAGRALHLAQRSGDAVLAAYGAGVRAGAALLAEGPAAAQPALCAAVAALAAAGRAYAACIAQGQLAQALVEAGEPEQGEDLARQVLATAREQDNEAAVRTAERTLIAAAIGRGAFGDVRRLLAEARHAGVPAPELATLEYLEGYCALRSGAYRAAAETLANAAKQLEKLDHPHLAARALLLRAEALVSNGVSRPAAEALNASAALVTARQCEGFLLPLAHDVRTVQAKRRALLRLNAPARSLLQKLEAAAAPPARVAEHREGNIRLDVNPFGNGAICLDGMAVDVAPLDPKARELLFYLALRGSPVRRDEATDAIWWEGARDRGRAALKYALYQLRCTLGDRCLPPFQTDIALMATIRDAGDALLTHTQAAWAACNAGDFQQAVASVNVATGYLEAGVFLQWCDSQWAAGPRASYLNAACRLAGLAREPRRDPALAAALERCCRAVIALDPLEKAAWAGLVRLHLTAGRADEALRCRREYGRVCREEL